MRVLRIEVTGLVQGVGFRWFTRDVARRFGLGGWVKNRPDGAVEIMVCGDDLEIDAFVDEVHRGPPGARVSALRLLSAGELDPVQPPFTVLR